MKDLLAKWNIDSLLTDSGVTFGLRTLAAFVAYFTFVLLARLLPPSDLGQFVFAQSFLWILIDLATLGLGFAATRFIPKAQVRGNLAEVTGYIRFTQRTVLITATVTAAALALLLSVLHAPSLQLRQSLILILCCGLPFGALTVANTYLCRSFNWFVLASSVGVTLRPIVFVGILLCFYSFSEVGYGPRLVAWSLVASLAFVAIVQTLLVKQKLLPLALPRVAVEKPRLWLSTAITLLLATVFTNYYLDIHVVLSGLFLPADELAIFNAALRTLAIVGFGSAAIGIAVAPRISALHAQRDVVGLNRLARRSIGITLVASTFGIALLAAFGRPILTLFGDVYVAGYPALLIAAIAQLVAATSTVLIPLVAMTGHHASLVRGLLVLLPLIILAHALLIGPLGMIGASWAFVVSAVLWALWIFWLVRRLVGLRLLSSM
ncbi:MAG: oligosaccharide flippase family protein [Pseudomonadales bacterium]